MVLESYSLVFTFSDASCLYFSYRCCDLTSSQPFHLSSLKSLFSADSKHLSSIIKFVARAVSMDESPEPRMA